MPNFDQKLKNLPQSPGVYQFFDDKGAVLYIGKAKNLRTRVKQYFNGSDERQQIPYLMKEIADFDYTVVNTELESLYLERTLIQKHRPKYNIELKDDKSYAFIVIDYSFEVPQVVIRRRLSDDNLKFQIPNFKSNPNTQNLKSNTYFGPFTSAKKIRDLIFTARRIFGLCSAAKVNKPCFYFHLHRCPGVCAGVMSLDEYERHLEKIKMFLSGKIAPSIKNIKIDMLQAATAKKFEKAARLRDQLKALELLEQRQNVIMAKAVNWDVIGLANDEGVWCVNLFKIRNGKMLDRSNFVYAHYANLTLLRGREKESSERAVLKATLQNFLEEYYSQTSDVPKQIYLPTAIDNENLIKSLARNRFKKTISIKNPKKGKTNQLIKLSQTNAQEYLKNYLNEKAGHLDKVQRGLAQLKTILGLPSMPKRIEGFDISNTQGTNPVGSMVVFQDGLPKKSEYRKFKIQTKDTPDDFSMMREMLARRMARSVIARNASDEAILPARGLPHPSDAFRTRNDKVTWPVPDLVVIDGGRGQLSTALDVLNVTPYTTLLPIPVIGLAKRIEEIFLPNQKKSIILPHDNPALQLLQRLRDEAHRFGITFHRHLRSKQAVRSALDEIRGIGPKTKKLLKDKFGTVASIKNASLDELSEIVGKKVATNIKKWL